MNANQIAEGSSIPALTTGNVLERCGPEEDKLTSTRGFSRAGYSLEVSKNSTASKKHPFATP